MAVAILLATFVFVGARLISARRAAAGDTGLEWLSVLPQGLGSVIFIWLGVRMAASNLVVGVALAAIGLVGLTLVIRAGER